jgi:hypothetical protein
VCRWAAGAVAALGVPELGWGFWVFRWSGCEEVLVGVDVGEVLGQWWLSE